MLIEIVLQKKANIIKAFLQQKHKKKSLFLFVSFQQSSQYFQQKYLIRMLKNLISKWIFLDSNLLKANKICFSITQIKPNPAYNLSSNIKRMFHRQYYVFQTSQLNVLKANDKSLQQLANLKGYNSIQYVNMLFSYAMKYSSQHIQKENSYSHPMIKKAQEYYIKIWQILQKNPYLKQKIHGLPYITQVCLGRLYLKTNRLDQSKYWYNLFLKKLQKSNIQDKQILNQFYLYAYSGLSLLFISREQFQQAKNNYNILINMMKTKRMKNVQRIQQLVPIRDYAFAIGKKNKEQGLKAMADLANLSNLKNHSQAKLVFKAHTFYVQMGEQKLVIELLERIVRQIEQAQENNQKNTVYSHSLQDLASLYRENKLYSMQYKTLKKIIFITNSGSNVQARHYKLLHLFVQKSQVQANLDMLSESYISLIQAQQKLKFVDQIPAKSQPFTKLLKLAQQTFQRLKLDKKYLFLLDHITKQIEKLRSKVNLKD